FHPDGVVIVLAWFLATAIRAMSSAWMPAGSGMLLRVEPPLFAAWMLPAATRVGSVIALGLHSSPNLHLDRVGVRVLHRVPRDLGLRRVGDRDFHVLRHPCRWLLAGVIFGELRRPGRCAVVAVDQVSGVEVQRP